MAMPMAFKNSGLILGVIGTVVTGMVCTHCMVILVRSAQTLYHRLKVPALGMGETAEAAFQSGPKRLRHLATFARCDGLNVLHWKKDNLKMTKTIPTAKEITLNQVSIGYSKDAPNRMSEEQNDFYKLGER